MAAERPRCSQIRRSGVGEKRLGWNGTHTFLGWRRIGVKSKGVDAAALNGREHLVRALFCANKVLAVWKPGEMSTTLTVSYTHLTLPTILLV